MEAYQLGLLILYVTEDPSQTALNSREDLLASELKSLEIRLLTSGTRDALAGSRFLSVSDLLRPYVIHSHLCPHFMGAKGLQLSRPHVLASPELEKTAITRIPLCCPCLPLSLQYTPSLGWLHWPFRLSDESSSFMPLGLCTCPPSCLECSPLHST